MANFLIRRLERFCRLSADDKAAVNDATSGACKEVAAQQDIITEGDSPEMVNVMLSGWACRYKQLKDGRRQIMAFFVPGDMCDLSVLVLQKMDYGVMALTPVRLAQISREVLSDLTRHHPRVLQALWWNTLVASAIEREWLFNLGQRRSAERVGHLLCELFKRLQAVGLAGDNTLEMPFTRTQLGSATGLSLMQVERSLLKLRSDGLIVLKIRTLHIPDWAALQAATDFNPNYLHLDHEGEHGEAETDG